MSSPIRMIWRRTHWSRMVRDGVRPLAGGDQLGCRVEDGAMQRVVEVLGLQEA
jgi:hypothetical protein